MISYKFVILIAAFLSLFLFSCDLKQVHTKNEIEVAMKKYDRLIQKMNTDSIALLYTKDGDLGNMAHGRDSIRKFLESFKAYKVLSQNSITDSIRITGDSAFQRGTYYQTTITPESDTLHVKGEFRVNWIWLRENGWNIKRIETKPL